ncbi:MAG TPA: adenylosuccinate lyase family protein [Thermoleophilaceae bacterium]
MGGGAFQGLFVPDHVAEQVSERAWVQAMLDVEAALAAAEAEAGIVPAEAAEAIAAACDAARFDHGQIVRDARDTNSPVVPLVKALTAALPDEAGRWVHWGATSQDVMDSASMLVAGRTLPLIDAELAKVAGACARLADEHRGTTMAARTLLQQALPTTFGLKAAGWLVGTGEARERLAGLQLAAELGGAAGTLASLGSDGIAVLQSFSQRLGLAAPALPWHSSRGRVGELGAALALAAGALEKIALDVTLMAQTEVGEVAESSEGGRGGSSTLPHKRNPVGAVRCGACARLARSAATSLLGGLAQEHERGSSGAWQAEWPALTDALALTGGAAWSLGESLDGIEVDPGRMGENLELTGGLLMAESVTMAIAGELGRAEAKRVVDAASTRAADGGRPFREVLLEDEAVAGPLGEDGIDRALDPSAYLGSAEAFIDRALERYGKERG